jgi:hypothetical protein
MDRDSPKEEWKKWTQWEDDEDKAKCIFMEIDEDMDDHQTDSLVIIPRKDQFGSVWLHMVMQILLSKHHKLRPLLQSEWLPYLNYTKNADELQPGLFQPFLDIEQISGDRRHDWSCSNFPRNTIQGLGMELVRVTGKSVPTLFAENMRDAYWESFVSVLSNTVQEHLERNVVAVHLREGDVAGISYNSETFPAFSHQVTKLLTSQESVEHKVKMMRESWEWGQCSLTAPQIKSLLDRIVDAHKDKELRVIAQSLSPEVIEYVENLGGIVQVNQKASLDFWTMVHSSILYAANSYMSFVAGMLHKDHQTVYIPRNAMFTSLGVGIDHPFRYYDIEAVEPTSLLDKPSTLTGAFGL